jgi:TolA-binding protein
MLLLIAAATVIGCGYSIITDRSVRFNSLRTGRGFYRLPPLPFMYDKATGRELSTKEIETGNYASEEAWDVRYAREQEVANEIDDTWNRALVAVDQGSLEQAQTELTKFLDLTELRDPGPFERQHWRNTATDMLDAIGSSRLGSSSKAIKAYLDARRQYDDPTITLNVSDLRSHAPKDRNLEDNWLYLEGAVAYKSGDKESAGERFHHLYAHYRQSEKREASLYMKAKLAMETSYSFNNSACDFEGETLEPYYSPSDEAETETDETKPYPEVDVRCRDNKRALALQTFRALVADYPNGRYSDDARGWIAHLHRRGGERAEALAEYYRLLGHPTSRVARLEAKRSLQLLGHHFNDETLDRVEELLATDVNGSMAYAYHRIYNQAVDYTYQEMISWAYSHEDWTARDREKKRVDKLHQTGKHELERVAKFATKMVQRFPRATVSGGFLTRVAEAQLELQNFADAASMATKALAMGVQGDIRSQALWVKGSGEHQTRRLPAAEATLKRLIEEFPKSRYAEGARRLLAMTAEDRGDLETALEIYLDLKYQADVAYFLDVLLPTERLAKFVGSHKSHPRYDQMLYGLGVRYMREKKWSDARAVLSSVRTESGVDNYLESDKNSTRHFSKEPIYEDDQLTYPKASWVMQDLKTIEIFERLEQSLAKAESEEARIEAMYQLASAYYEADDLAFYNPSAWGGGRVESLLELMFTDLQRLPNESQIILDHLKEHDPLAHSIPIFEEIVAQYPASKVAPDALYSVAVAHERLYSRNGSWTTFYERGVFPGSRNLGYADVANIYPNYQLPRGTYGWKPSSRTVNGGPGWAPRPKPLPKETREHKVKRLLRELKTEVRTDVGKIANKLSSVIEPRVEAGFTWYGSAIEAAIYGVLSGIGLWVVLLIGIRLHLRKLLPEAVVFGTEEPPLDADSRVDKMIE